MISSYELSEVSASPGGLPLRWLIKAALPVGFALLLLSVFSRLLRVWHFLFLAESSAPTTGPTLMAANEVLAVLMFVSFIALVFSGFPVAWLLGGLAVIFSALAIVLQVVQPAYCLGLVLYLPFCGAYLECYGKLGHGGAAHVYSYGFAAGPFGHC